MARSSSADRLPARIRCLLAAGALLCATPVLSMQALEDEVLSGVTAQDGLQVEISSANPISSNTINWMTDGAMMAAPNNCNTAAPSGGVANQQACSIINGLTLSGVSPSPLFARFELDVGASAQTGANNTNISLFLDWDPLWITFNGFTLRTPTVDSSANSVGALGFRSDGYLRIVNRGGLFNNSGFLATVDFSSGGDIILRQGAVGSPELSFGNFLLTNRFTNGFAGGHVLSTGRIALDNNGLLVDSNFAYADLLFDVMYKGAPTVAFDTSLRDSLLLFGWQGGLVNPSFRISPGGYNYNSTLTSSARNVLNASSFTFQNENPGAQTPSQGLSLTTAWTFDSDFTFVLGQAGGNRTQVRFTKWQDMGTTTQPWLLMPITFDILQENNPATMGLCFGGGFTAGVPTQAHCTSDKGVTGNATGDVGQWFATGVGAGKAALAALIRDAHLWAYNTEVEVRDSTVGATKYNWGLIYTFGKMDGDIFIYPEGRGTGEIPIATNTGVKLDVTLMSQSPGYWERANSTDATTRAAADDRWATNTHFMLADTNVGGGGTQFGIGLANADLVWRARNLYMRIVNSDPGYPDLPGGLWLQSDTASRYFMRGLLGGGTLSDLSQPTGIALTSIDLATSRFIFVLSPENQTLNDVPVGFDALFDFDGTAAFTMAELSQPTAAFRLRNLEGRVVWKNGTVGLVTGANNPPTNRPQAVIQNELLFGTSADLGSGGGKPLVGNIGFGTENYGRLIFPSGEWYNRITIKMPST